jgi:hypothetical protein
MKGFLLMSLCIFAFAGSPWAQTDKKCGYDFIHAAAIKRNPNFDAEHAALRAEAIKNAASVGAKRTTATAVTVPVVFHIVLDSDYLKLMDASTIADRVNSQMEVLNEDYNRGNADSTLIPSVFKSLYGDAAIHFGLARVDPNGNATPGWEVVMTNKTGFELNNDDPGGNGKYTDSGGADAWDVTKYINVWVVNFLVNGSPSTTIGLTIMPSWTGTASGDYPKNEMGVMLRYDAWGRRSSSSENFFANIDQGRTLTHEMGHFFEMIHIWGDDGGLCPGSGGKDDGMADTPPQADATYGCPSFPKFDACTNSGTGIMFMNYMDYTDDACMYMFTNDQVTMMRSQLDPTGESYSLTQHPELLAVPDVPAISASNLSIYPNPTTGKINLTFAPAPKDLQAVSVVNILGQKVWEKSINKQQISILNIDLSGMTKGIYFVECQYSSGKDVRKIMLQ